jgi:cytoskeletal protein RodZ
VRLAAIILAVILISPGGLWGQVLPPGSRAQDSPQQTDKAFTQEQQKKQQKQLKNRKKQSPPSKKGKRTSSRTEPIDKPMRGGPVGQGVK